MQNVQTYAVFLKAAQCFPFHAECQQIVLSAIDMDRGEIIYFTLGIPAVVSDGERVFLLFNLLSGNCTWYRSPILVTNGRVNHSENFGFSCPDLPDGTCLVKTDQ
jgi:hypothetical protein